MHSNKLGRLLRSWTPTLCLLPLIAEAAPVDDFHALLDEHWATAVREQVFFRSDPDAWRMHGKLAEFTPAAFERRRRYNDSVLERLTAIDPRELNAADRLSYRVFDYERTTERQSFVQPERYFPITSIFGYHTYFAEAPANMAFLVAEDYERYLVSLDDFPRYNRELIGLLREAIPLGYTQPCEAMQGYDETIRQLIVTDPAMSTLYVPFRKFPQAIPDDRQADLAARGTALIADKVMPAFHELLDFYTREYMPACRKSVGISSVPNGAAYYAYLVRYFTTTDMSPEEIHALGKRELARIRAEMEAIIDRVGFEGDFDDFLAYLRSEPRFYAKTVDELLGRAALIAKTAEGELPRFFSVLPRGTYNIKPNPGRGAYYMPSTGDGTTPGTYFVGTAQLDAEPLYTLEALTLHEAVPGHHLQTALAFELELPEFRRHIVHSAFAEGWGLYAERLGKEMGFYQDPYSDFGRLTYEAWRACRLIVDTGLHVFGWSREQAIEFLLANTALSQYEATSEIDRYITWPGQALAYKIGEMRIREMRHRAEQALGSRFDIRRFHDTVIGNASLPIAVLDQVIDEWITNERGSQAH